MTNTNDQTITGGFMYLDVDNLEKILDRLGERPDPFADDEPLECGVENPEGCESCQ